LHLAFVLCVDGHLLRLNDSPSQDRHFPSERSFGPCDLISTPFSLVPPGATKIVDSVAAIAPPNANV
jgi:hypothetical protein